ncbi:hypothetical protein [Nocardioides albus]|uniref:Uncharacterized protein n=1 Tax=Nocardioides albus TaxID=1841 RepID=A0A7W5A305_9ACTN|nr:hypothetical protein [Nocardioides albus]MBB3088549.1 hypothetical protein [Nocardioides albus]GGU17070.1 hypothetical protein GCM10007979_14390 [Nocardioides albus]
MSTTFDFAYAEGVVYVDGNTTNAIDFNIQIINFAATYFGLEVEEDMRKMIRHTTKQWDDSEHVEAIRLEADWAVDHMNDESPEGYVWSVENSTLRLDLMDEDDKPEVEPITVAHEIEICHDCACVIANGECVVMSGEFGEGYKDIAGDLIDLWRERWPVEMNRVVLACGDDCDDCPNNAYRTCDLCERSDSTSDHRAAVLSR